SSGSSVVDAAIVADRECCSEPIFTPFEGSAGLLQFHTVETGALAPFCRSQAIVFSGTPIAAPHAHQVLRSEFPSALSTYAGINLFLERSRLAPVTGTAHFPRKS